MSGGNYQLKFHQSELQWLFNGSYGTLYGIQDTNGNLVAFNYDGNGNLTSLTDTQGRSVTFTQNAATRSPRSKTARAASPPMPTIAT